MASSLLNDDEDNATRNTQQQQQQQQQQQEQNQKNNNLTDASSSSTSSNKMQDNEAKLKKQNLEQRKQELEKLLNEKSWLLQQLQKQETQILNGNFEYLNFNDFISNLALQYNEEQTNTNSQTNSNADTVSNLSGGGGGGGGLNNLSTGEESILRRKPLTAKENYQNSNINNNVLHRRQSELSNRSSEYDNYPQNDNQSTHSEGGRGGVMLGASPGTQQYSAKAALKKRSATVAGTTAQSSTNLQMIRQQHLEQQQQQLLYKQQQQQQGYHHQQQHLYRQHIDQHQVLMPHLQYATQKFYYTTLQPQNITLTNQQPQSSQQQQLQQQQHQYGRYIQNKQIAQQQTLHHSQNLNNTIQQTQQQQQHILLTPPSAISGLTIDNISLYSLNSNNVATLHRPAQQQQPIIVQCDKYYLSPTSHHISHNDGGGFIKSSQNIKEYISPQNSPQHLNLGRDKNRAAAQSSQTNITQRGTTPALDIISLAPSYMSMETIDYSTSPETSSHMRWRSQSNLPPLQNAAVSSADIKSHSSDMLNNNQYYNTALNPPPPSLIASNLLLTQNQNLLPPPNVTQVKPFKPLDDVSLTSYTMGETQKKLKPKQWLESSLDGPVIRQTPVQEDTAGASTSFSSTFHHHHHNNQQTRAKLSSQSLNTARHYSMSSTQTKNNQNHLPTSAQANQSKLSQSTSYLNQLDLANANQANTPTPSISQPYNLELSPQTTAAYKYLAAQQKAQTIRPLPTAALYVNTSNSHLAAHSATPTPPLTATLTPDIRLESPVNMTVVQPATFQPYKEITKPFEMSDFYKYSTKFRQKENNNNND